MKHDDNVPVLRITAWKLFPETRPAPFMMDYIVTVDTNKGRASAYGRWNGFRWETDFYPKEYGSVSVVAWAELPMPYNGGGSDDEG